MSVRLVITRRSPSVQNTVYGRGKQWLIEKFKVTEIILAGTRKENISAILSFT